MSNQNNQYLVCRNSKDDNFSLWQLNPDNPRLVSRVKTAASATIAKDNHVVQVGNYVLQWSPLNADDLYNYRLMEFNPDQPNPFGRNDGDTWSQKSVQVGSWSKGKFFGSRSDFANSKGAKKGYEAGSDLILRSMHNFVLNWIPTEGRGTYQLFNFDPGSRDPLPASITPQGAWLNIQKGHELHSIGGYVIDWEASTGAYSIWQFDAQNKNPLSYPAIQSGNWKSLGIDKTKCRRCL